MMTIADAGRPEVMAIEVGKCFCDQPAFHINMKADQRVRVVDVLRLDRTGACDMISPRSIPTTTGPAPRNRGRSSATAAAHCRIHTTVDLLPQASSSLR
jgi:hypothetical protein